MQEYMKNVKSVVISQNSTGFPQNFVIRKLSHNISKLQGPFCNISLSANLARNLFEIQGPFRKITFFFSFCPKTDGPGFFPLLLAFIFSLLLTLAAQPPPHAAQKAAAVGKQTEAAAAGASGGGALL